MIEILILGIGSLIVAIIIYFILNKKEKVEKVIVHKTKRGRPGLPSGKYRINGVPVYEDVYQKWLSKQNRIERFKTRVNNAIHFKDKLESFELSELEFIVKQAQKIVNKRKRFNKLRYKREKLNKGKNIKSLVDLNY